MTRHCSKCGKAGHDKRKHRRRRNPGPVWDVAANVIGGHIYQKYLDHRSKIGGGKKHKYL